MVLLILRIISLMFTTFRLHSELALENLALRGRRLELYMTP